MVAISCSFFSFSARGHSEPAAAEQQAAAGAAEAAASEAADVDIDGEEDEEELVVASLAAVAGGPTGTKPRRGVPGGVAAAPSAAEDGCKETIVFLLHPQAAAQRQEAAERSSGPKGSGAARVLLFASEAELLVTWIHCLRRADPDVIALFEVSFPAPCAACRLPACVCSPALFQNFSTLMPLLAKAMLSVTSHPQLPLLPPLPACSTGERHAGGAAAALCCPAPGGRKPAGVLPVRCCPPACVCMPAISSVAAFSFSAWSPTTQQPNRYPHIQLKRFPCPAVLSPRSSPACCPPPQSHWC